MTHEERQEATGFLHYWKLLGRGLGLSEDDVKGWSEDQIADGFERLGYIAVNLDSGDNDWPYGDSPVDDVIDYLLETGQRVETPWSGCAGVSYGNLWFRNVEDAVKARLVVNR